MNQTSLCSFFFFFSSLLTRITMCSSLNPKFEACQPTTCGNQHSISYPFYIEGRQESFCGFPGFGLSCPSNDSPILNLFDTQFIVHEISYPNQSIRVSDAAFSLSNGSSCVIPRPYNPTLNGSEFSFAPNQKDLFLVFGCKLKSLPERLSKYRIGCSAENETDSVFAMTEEGEDLRLASERCNGGVVKTKVEDDKNGTITREVVRRGILLNWTASNCSLCMKTGGKCGFDGELYNFRCYCPDRDHPQKCAPEDPKLGLKLGLGLAIGFGLIATLGLFIVLLKPQRYNVSCFQNRSIYFDVYSITDPEFLTLNSGVRLFSFEELEEATNRFDPSRVLGYGGFGTVYYGILHDKQEVAIKRSYKSKRVSKRLKQFMNEIQILTRLRHGNLVSLYGCTSNHSRELLLVYEYIPNGTVSTHLHGRFRNRSSLPWPVRMKIALETASALTYLHASGIIHRDVKTNNILLCDDFWVKVADFGISRLFPEDVSHVSTDPQGTLGYVDPEYYECHKLTDKSDVYSFGVVLIELISSMRAVDSTRNVDEIKLAKLAIKKIQRREFTGLVDPCLGFESVSRISRMIVSVAELAFQCLQRDRELRPTMYGVLKALQKIEKGNDEAEHLEIHGVEISKSLSLITRSTSKDLDEAASLKDLKLSPHHQTF